MGARLPMCFCWLASLCRRSWPESAGNVSHVHRGATVSGHANTKDQRGHLTKEVKICPKKDDVAMLAVISLGYDSPHTLTASSAGT